MEHEFPNQTMDLFYLDLKKKKKLVVKEQS